MRRVPAFETAAHESSGLDGRCPVNPDLQKLADLLPLGFSVRIGFCLRV